MSTPLPASAPDELYLDGGIVARPRQPGVALMQARYSRPTPTTRAPVAPT